MRSKSSLTVKSDIDEYIAQIIEQNDLTRNQLSEIDHLLKSREQSLDTLIVSFDEFLQEYEKNHPKNKKWHTTLEVAKLYLNRK